MKWFKRLLLAAVLLLAFIVIAMIGIVVLVDPNDYRDEITAAVKQQTGRDLVIEGEIGLSVFPWLGLELGRVRLDNPPGFTDQVFAEVERVNIKVALLPLLRLETRIGDLEMDGLTVNLERRADGVTNWDDLTGATAAQPVPPDAPAQGEPEAPAPAAPETEVFPQFYVGSLEITNTNLSWRDAMGKVYARIVDLNLSTGEILPLKSIPFTLEFGLRNDSPKLLAGARLKGAARMDLAGEQYALENLDFRLEASGPMVPGGNQTLTLQLPRLVATTETMELSQLKMQLAGLNLTLDAKAQMAGESPQVSGQLSADALQLRKLMESLGMEPPVTTDPAVLNFLNAQLAFTAGADTVELKNLKVTFDETTLTGELAVRDFAATAPAYRVNLNIDRINADRYLPPPEPEAASDEEPAAPAGDIEVPLPVDDLRALKAEGSLAFGELQFLNLKLSNLKAGLKSAGDGLVRLEPLSVDLYSGNFNGAVVIDVTEKAPQYKISTELSKVQIEPMLFDYMQSRFISGQMNAKFDIATRGRRLSQFKKNLSGVGNLNFRDGAFSTDFREKLREAEAKLRRKPYKPSVKKPTTFSSITAGLDIENGTVSNKDLEVRAGHIYMTGEGQYALRKETIDYTVTLLFSEDPTSQDEALAEFYDIPIKLRLKGPMEKIDYVDVVTTGLGSAVKGKMKKEVQEKKDAARQELKEKIDEKLPREKKDELKQKLLKKLGGD